MPDEPTHPAWRRLTAAAVAATLVLLLLFTAGIGGLSFNSHYSAYFDVDDPSWADHRDLFQQYQRADSVLVILHSPHAPVTEPPIYRALVTLAGQLSELPYASSALSVADLDIDGAVPDEELGLIPGPEQVRQHDRAIGLAVSSALDYAIVRVEFDLPDRRADTVLTTLEAVRAVAEPWSRANGLTVHYSGTLALNEAYIDVVRNDSRTTLPLLLVVMCALLGILLGSASALAAVLPIGLLSVLGAAGIAGLLNTKIAAINSFLPVIIMTISIAGCVHMALTYAQTRRSGELPRKAAWRSVKANVLPMALANGTTIAGFLGLLLSPSPPVRVLGWVVAVGVLLSFLLCMSLLPVLLARLDPWRSRQRATKAAAIGIASWALRRRAFILLLFGASLIPGFFLAASNAVSDSVFEYFPDTHRFAADTRIVEEVFSGINEVIYEIDFGNEEALFDARNMHHLADLADWLDRQPEVRRLTSLSRHHTIVEAMSENRLQERLNRYRDNLRSGSTPPILLAREVSDDFSASIVQVYLQKADSAALLAFDQKLRQYVSQAMPDVTVRSAGAALMFAQLGQNNIRDMLTALSAALIFSAIILGIAQRSVRTAIAGLLCNIFPVLAVYSVWAVFDGRISIGAAVVMGMIVGIVIDDTIYLLTAYRRERRAASGEAILAAAERVGPALLVTTVVLVAGLGVGMLSQFGPVRSMSVLSVSVIAVAIVADLAVLPALLASRREVRHG